MFTKTELEVMDLLCKGLNVAEIAEKMFIQPSTVSYHLLNLYRKTGVNSAKQLMALHIKDLKKQIKRLETNVKQLEKYKQQWEYLRDKEMKRC